MPKEPLFLDTTIHVDRILKEFDTAHQAKIDSLLSQFNIKVSCGFSRVEYKRVILQNLALVLHFLVEEQSFFAALARCQKLQGRRPTTLTNIVAWIGLKINETVTGGDELDAILRLRSESYIRNSIVSLWYRFERDVTVVNHMNCQRALEVPIAKKNGTFDTAIHQSECAKKTCNNAGFFQSQLPNVNMLCRGLEEMRSAGTLTPELEKSLDMMKLALGGFSKLQDYNNCLKVGDVWMHLEALKSGVKNFATTNYKESGVLCPLLSMTMHEPNPAPRRTP